MATFFGEILDIESRAVLEDCDAEGFGVEVEVLDATSLNSSYETLIITDGELVTSFAQVAILDSETKKIALFRETLTLDCKKPPSVLYKLSSGPLIFTTHDRLDIKLANTLLLKLLPWLEKCSDVVILTSRHISLFKSKGRSDVISPVVRCLATSSYKKTRFAPNLESGNYIYNFSASVLSFCKVKGRSAVLYIDYTDCSTVDLLSAAPFIEILKNLDLKNLLKLHSIGSKKNDIKLSSNLYI